MQRCEAVGHTLLKQEVVLAAILEEQLGLRFDGQDFFPPRITESGH
jgi:hypothetical protein